MELKKDPELMFLEDLIKFVADLNEKTRLLQLEYDILIGKLAPPDEKGKP
jgi:hypothetical protein